MHEYYALEYEVGFDMPYLIRAQASAIRGLVRLETCKYGVLMEYTWVARHDECTYSSGCCLTATYLQTTA